MVSFNERGVQLPLNSDYLRFYRGFVSITIYTYKFVGLVGILLSWKGCTVQLFFGRQVDIL